MAVRELRVVPDAPRMRSTLVMRDAYPMRSMISRVDMVLSSSSHSWNLTCDPKLRILARAGTDTKCNHVLPAP